MMRALYRLRRSVALFICPELALPYSGMTKPMERAARDAWLAGECEAARSYRGREPHGGITAEGPFISAAEMDALIARRRHRRVERCKEILQVIYLVNEGGLPQEPDLFLDARAERLAVLLFEEKPND